MITRRMQFSVIRKIRTGRVPIRELGYYKASIVVRYFISAFGDCLIFLAPTTVAHITALRRGGRKRSIGRAECGGE